MGGWKKQIKTMGLTEFKGYSSFVNSTFNTHNSESTNLHGEAADIYAE